MESTKSSVCSKISFGWEGRSLKYQFVKITTSSLVYVFGVGVEILSVNPTSVIGVEFDLGKGFMKISQNKLQFECKFTDQLCT
jgi:hypothetical protein